MRKRWTPVADYCIGGITMNAVGIDVSKGKSIIAVMRPFGEVVFSPFEVSHSSDDLRALAKQLKSLDGETRIIMEATGNYHFPVAMALYEAGFYVSVVNAIIVHNYRNDTLRKAKTDKKDAIKLANYGIDKWLKLPKFIPEEDVRIQLKSCYRQYRHYSKIQTMLHNNLISLLDTVFPDVNRLFSSPQRSDGSEKWVDFVETFWHCECVCGSTPNAFEKKYQRWCKKHHYNFNSEKAFDIYTSACGYVSVMPKNETTHILVKQAVLQLKASAVALAELKKEMLHLAKALPEYTVVMQMYGVGPTLGPQLLAEIGDVRRFYSKKALVAFAGLDSPANDSGKIVGNHKGMSKIGAASLRRTLFLIMSAYLMNSPKDEPVYQYMDKKRTEGKPYMVYMMAAANKFLRIYYATVTSYLNTLENT